MRRAYDALGIQCPTTATGPTLRQSINAAPNIPNVGNSMQGVRVLALPGSAAPNVSLPLSSDPTSNALQAQGVNQTAASPQQSVNSVMFGLPSRTNAANQGLVSQLSGGFQLGQVTASPVTGTKEWHQSVTPGLRNHLVQKLVHVFFPMPHPQALLDESMHNFVAYAKMVEGDMYEMANSRSEYYYLFAEKIYKIQKELEEKRQKRQEQQLHQQHTQQQPIRQGLVARPPDFILPCLQQQQLDQAQDGPRCNSHNMFLQQNVPQSQPQTNLVGLPGPSSTTSNPGFSPFGNPFSQGSMATTSSNNQPLVTDTANATSTGGERKRKRSNSSYPTDKKWYFQQHTL